MARDTQPECGSQRRDVGGHRRRLGQDETRARHFPHGGLHWRAASDKQGVDSIVPICDRVRAALLEYLGKNPRLGEAFLFPATQDERKPVRKGRAGNWLMSAEKLAGLSKLSRGRWHPYRRLWATERKHLPSQDVAAAGGWNDTQALTTIYQKADPGTVLRVVEAGGA